MSSTHTARVAPERTEFSARLAAVPFYAERLEKRMAKMTYFEQLRSPHWQRRRLEIMSRDEFTCQGCYDQESTLNVHHKHYIKGRMAWEYGDDELVTLCEACHEDMHEQSNVMKRLFSLLPTNGPIFINEALALVAGYAGRKADGDFEQFESLSPYMFRLGAIASHIERAHSRVAGLDEVLAKMDREETQHQGPASNA
jgi:hypothetical protein